VTVTARKAAATRSNSPARTTPPGLPGPNSWPGWGRSFRSSARRVAATSDGSRSSPNQGPSARSSRTWANHSNRHRCHPPVGRPPTGARSCNPATTPEKRHSRGGRHARRLRPAGAGRWEHAVHEPLIGRAMLQHVPLARLSFFSWRFCVALAIQAGKAARGGDTLVPALAIPGPVSRPGRQAAAADGPHARGGTSGARRRR
jgi:hypothetical protein